MQPTKLRGGGKRTRLDPKDREKRIVSVLLPLIGDDKTTIQISKVVPLESVTIRNILRNLKHRGYVMTDPPVCSHHGWVKWKITPSGISRAMRGGNHA